MKRQSRKTKETERDRRGWFIENNVETGWSGHRGSIPPQPDTMGRQRGRETEMWRRVEQESQTREIKANVSKWEKKSRGRPERPANRWMIDEMKGKQKREKSYKKWGRKGDKMLRREEGLGEGKGKRAEEVTEAKERKKWQKGKERSQGRQKWDKILVTQIDEGARRRKKGENSFSKPARRRVPAVFIWPLTSRPLQSLQDPGLTSRHTHTHTHTHTVSVCTSPQCGWKQWITEALLYLIKTEQRLDRLTGQEIQTFVWEENTPGWKLNHPPTEEQYRSFTRNSFS